MTDPIAAQHRISGWLQDPANAAALADYLRKRDLSHLSSMSMSTPPLSAEGLAFCLETLTALADVP